MRGAEPGDGARSEGRGAAARLAARLERLLARALPGVHARLQARFGRYPRLARRFIRRHGLVVSGGPFAGLVYPRRAAFGRIVAKLAGSYEEEVHRALEETVRRGAATVVNVGAAEGYYAVGLARALPAARVHAFEADGRRLRLCAALARANGVAQRVVLHGACAPADLAALPLDGALVVCDCEGCEGDLLRPDLLPGLRGAALIVELHEAFVPGVTAAVTSRFAGTHAVEVIPERPHDPARYPAVAWLDPEKQAMALDEHRRGADGRALAMSWAVMIPRG